MLPWTPGAGDPGPPVLLRLGFLRNDLLALTRERPCIAKGYDGFDYRLLEDRFVHVPEKFAPARLR